MRDIRQPQSVSELDQAGGAQNGGYAAMKGAGAFFDYQNGQQTQCRRGCQESRQHQQEGRKRIQ